jgi:hypothetical protein
MTQSRLHEVNRSAPIQSMGGVRVPQPMRGHRKFDPGPPGGCFHNPPDPGVGQGLASLAGGKDGVLRWRLPAQFR